MEFKQELKAFFSDWIAAFKHLFEEKHPTNKAEVLAQQSVMEIEGALMMMRLYKDKSLLEAACQRVLGRLERN